MSADSSLDPEPFQEFLASVFAVQESQMDRQFLSAIMEALAATTMEFMAKNPARAAQFRKYGFEAYWNGIVVKFSET